MHITTISPTEHKFNAFYAHFGIRVHTKAFKILLARMYVFKTMQIPPRSLLLSKNRMSTAGVLLLSAWKCARAQMKKQIAGAIKPNTSVVVIRKHRPYVDPGMCIIILTASLYLLMRPPPSTSHTCGERESEMWRRA
jgi:hypothetical protein